MDSSAIHADIKKAMSLISKKHGLEAVVKIAAGTSEACNFNITIGECVDQDYIQYLQHRKPQMQSGHHYFKHVVPGLCDEMLGKRLHAKGRDYVYLGCMTSRPRYPVSVLQVERNGGYTPLKCTKDFLNDFVRDFERRIGTPQRDQRVTAALNAIDPELASGALY